MDSENTRFLQEMLDDLVSVIKRQSAEIDPLDNTQNGQPEITILCQEVVNTLSANTRTREKVPERRETIRVFHKLVDNAYTEVVTADNARDMAFPPRTAMLVGALHFLLSLLAVELAILPPPGAHPNSIGVMQFYAKEPGVDAH